MPFNYNEYQTKTSQMSTEQLQKEWENYTRQIAGGATSTATSVLFSPLTAGISLMGLGLSAPRIHNARKKRDIIEKGLQERGSTHNTRSRDVAGSMALSGAISVATLGLAGPLADAAAGEAVGKGVEYAAAHLALDGVGEVIEHKHSGHLKKKAEQDLKMKAMQAQLAQIQGGQQQVMMNGQMQMMDGQSYTVNGQMVYQGKPMTNGFQQPSLTAGMALPQPGILMQNQQQVQWQQQDPTMQIPGMQQPQLQIPGLQPGVVPPMRPHSAAPDNQYGQYAVINSQVQTQQQFVPQPPQYQQVQDSKFILNVVPNHQESQMTPNGFPNEKSAAYTTEHMQGDMTPLPLYSQQTTDQSRGGAQHPTHIDLPEGPTMEEEIAYLKARLLQMELEKRGLMTATISGPLEISLDPPKPREVEKKEEREPTIAIAEVSATTEVKIQQTSQPQEPEHPVVHIETHMETQTQIISEAPQPQRRDTLSAPLIPNGRPISPSIPQSQYAPPPAQPQGQQYAQVHDQQPPAQAQYAQQTSQPKQYTPQPAQNHQRQGSLAAPPIPAGRPVSTAPPLQQYAPPTWQQQQQQQHQYPPNQAQPPVQSYQAPPPPASQSYTPAPLYQPQPINPSLQANQAPPPPATQQPTQQQQYAPIQKPQQQYTPQPQKQTGYTQISACPPAQAQRQDSGYYSQASTPHQRPVSSISSISSISSPVHRHPSVSAVPIYDPQHHQQQQQQHQQYNAQMHGRSASVSSISSPTPPPPYFAPPPGSQQPALAGKMPDYFNQGPQTPVQMQNPMQMQYGQQQMQYAQPVMQGQMVGINEKMGMHYGQVGVQQQVWGQGQMMMGQPGMMVGGQQQMVRGGGPEPNYGPPPNIPQRM